MRDAEEDEEWKVSPEVTTAEVWKHPGERMVEKLFNVMLDSEKMSEEWRKSVLVLIFRNKDDVQSRCSYRGKKPDEPNDEDVGKSPGGESKRGSDDL